MKIHASEGRLAVCAQPRLDRFSDHILFRISLFTLCVAVGYYFTRFLFEALHQLPLWGSSAHGKAAPVADMLRTLHSGFGD